MSDTVRYKCAQCGAVDSATEPHPPTGPLNCWSCKAGRQMDPAKMREQGIGMFRTDDHVWLILKDASPRERAAD